MTPLIFISHSSHDRREAARICDALERLGLGCWLASRDIDPGENFQEAIVHAIRSVRVMVLVFTGNANNSNEIKKEMGARGAAEYALKVIDPAVPAEKQSSPIKALWIIGGAVAGIVLSVTISLIRGTAARDSAGR